MDGYYEIRGVERHVVALLHYGIGAARTVALYNKETRCVERVSYANFDNEAVDSFIKYTGGKLCR